MVYLAVVYTLVLARNHYYIRTSTASQLTAEFSEAEPFICIIHVQW